MKFRSEYESFKDVEILDEDIEDNSLNKNNNE